MKNPAAVALGSIKTAKKAASSAANGKLGGRHTTQREKVEVRFDRERISFTDKEFDFIFADWPEGDAHYRWLMTASRDEIQSWIDAAK